MSNFNYLEIRPLIVESAIEDGYLYATFKCSKTDKMFFTSTYLHARKKQSEFSYNEQTAIPFIKKIRKLLLPLLSRNILKKPFLSNYQFSDVDLTNPPKEIKSALILCFNQISKFFLWDESGKIWYYHKNNELPCENFIEFLEETPIEKPEDKLIFSRMLVEIAMADEELVKEEEEFLNTYLPKEYSSFHELFSMPRLTFDELNNVRDTKVKDVMLMICWAIALTDQNLDLAENERLYFYAKAFGISENRVKKIKYFAQEYILEKLIEQIYSLDYKGKEIVVSLNNIASSLINATAKNIGVSINDTELIIERNKVKLSDEILMNIK